MQRRFNSRDFGNDYVIERSDLRTLLQSYIQTQVKDLVQKELEDYFRKKYSPIYDEG